jgi:hypothetical protein
MLDLPLWAWAPLIGGAYIAVSWVTNDFFPFSRYPMYASAVTREAGAIPVFRADGEVIPIDEFTDFTGMDPALFYPPHTPCSLEWQIHEATRYVSKHLSDGEPGPVEVFWGFLYISVDEKGEIQERLDIVQSGHARRRR